MSQNPAAPSQRRLYVAPERPPAGFCRGAGHLVVYGNPAFVATFGSAAVGMPARESLVELPAGAFALLDAVLTCGKPLARWIRFAGAEWRMTVTPRVDPGNGEVYGVVFHLRARSDFGPDPTYQSSRPSCLPVWPVGTPSRLASTARGGCCGRDN